MRILSGAGKIWAFDSEGGRCAIITREKMDGGGRGTRAHSRGRIRKEEISRGTLRPCGGGDRRRMGGQHRQAAIVVQFVFIDYNIPYVIVQYDCACSCAETFSCCAGIPRAMVGKFDREKTTETRVYYARVRDIS